MITTRYSLGPYVNYDQYPIFDNSFPFRLYDKTLKRKPALDSESIGRWESENITEKAVIKWLIQFGLKFNPFDSRFLDAGVDPQLSAYLVGHEAFVAIWGNWPSFVFAPVGGGKSAFRVRLARACRVGQDGRRIFPVIYKSPGPGDFETWPPTLNEHLYFLNQAIAVELLLELAYRPWHYLKLNRKTRQAVRHHLEANLVVSLEYLLAQLEEAGNLSPLIEDFDPTAAQLLNPPDAASIRRLCADLRALSPESPDSNPALQHSSPLLRFQTLTQLIKESLDYEAIYLLIDGVDAYVESANNPQASVLLIQSLLDQTHKWAGEQVYAKYFLSSELEPLILAASSPALTKIAKPTKITWTTEMLIEVLQKRLQVASQGMFNSLDAISSPDLRGTEAKLVRIAKPLPREVLVLAERMLVEHIRSAESTDKLKRADLKAASKWYLDQQQLLA